MSVVTREYLQRLSAAAHNQIPTVEITVFLQGVQIRVLAAANDGHTWYRHDIPSRLAQFHQYIEGELQRQYPGCTVNINVLQHEIYLNWS